MKKRSHFRHVAHRVWPDLSYRLLRDADAADRRAYRQKAALAKPGAKIAASERWGAAEREQARKGAARSAAWTGARA